MFVGKSDEELKRFLNSCISVVFTTKETLESTERMIVCLEEELAMRSREERDLLC